METKLATLPGREYITPGNVKRTSFSNFGLGWTRFETRGRDTGLFRLFGLFVLGLFAAVLVTVWRDELGKGFAFHHGQELFAGERLALEQSLHDGVELLSVRGEDVGCAAVALLDDVANLFVDLLCDL